MIILRQKEYSSLKDELKEAIREGDTEKIEKLRKRYARRGRIIGAASGLGVSAAQIIRSQETTNKQLDDIYEKAKEAGVPEKELKNMRRGTMAAAHTISAGIGTGGGAAIGHLIGKSKFEKALRKAKEELKNEE